MPIIQKTVNMVVDTQGLHSAASTGDLVAMATQIEQLIRRAQMNPVTPNAQTASPPK